MAEETTGARPAAKAAAAPRKRRTAAPRGRKTCAFCAEGAKAVDYKQVDVLRRYITERGQIRPRRKTTLCAKHQRRLALAIKRARFMALLPYTSEHIRIYGG